MKKGAKVKVELFDRTRSKLKGFLAQLDAHFYMEPADTTSERNIRIIRFMTRAALQWGQMYLDSWFNFRKENQGKDNAHRRWIAVMLSRIKFEQAMKLNFRDINEQRTARQYIKHMKQKGSATAYVAKYQRII